jgi:hypothetical protein
MLFNRTFYLKSQKSPAQISTSLVGQHLKVHDLDFEVFLKDEVIKIIPHAEEKEGVLTLPISNITLSKKNDTTSIKLSTHPRRIDIGGPYILMILCIFAIVAGYLLGATNTEYTEASKVMMGIGALVAAIFWIKMEFGYFDYVRKIKNWVKEKI